MDTETTPTNTELAQQHAAGLRALADMLEQNPDLAEFATMDGLYAFHVTTSDAQAALARAALRQGAKVTKDIWEKQHNLRLTWGPLSALVLARRDNVCERVPTGVQKVTKTIKDPDAVAALPDVEIVEEVETFEWKCQPLLAVLDGEQVPA